MITLLSFQIWWSSRTASSYLCRLSLWIRHHRHTTCTRPGCPISSLAVSFRSGQWKWKVFILSPSLNAVYTLEAILKLLGLGVRRYFMSWWNTFDFVITSLGIVSLVLEVFNIPIFYIVILRPLRY